MADDCKSLGVGCAQILLMSFNFVLWLSGAGIFGVGIWILVDPKLKDVIEVVHGDEDVYFNKAAYILITFGVFIFLGGFCGCVGAIKRNNILLGLYIAFLFIVFAGELSAGIPAAVFKDDIIKALDKVLAKAIEKGSETLDDAFDAVQKLLKCCGAKGPTDYTEEDGTLGIPESCCILDSSGEPADKSQCMTNIPGYLYETGCTDKLVEWVKSHSTVLIGVGCGLAGLQIVGLVFAFCLCRKPSI